MFATKEGHYVEVKYSMESVVKTLGSEDPDESWYLIYGMDVLISYKLHQKYGKTYIIGIRGWYHDNYKQKASLIWKSLGKPKEEVKFEEIADGIERILEGKL